MQLNDDILSQWESIVTEVHKTDVPLECIRKMVFKLNNRRQKTVNIHALKRQGLGFDEIESIITRMFNDFDSDICDVDFVIDIASVAKIVQPETDRILGKL
jgi:uncharacterized protein YeeX (DUF496 family)